MTKHLTLAEKRARRVAEASLESHKRVYLRPPSWLSAEAVGIFKTTVKRLRGYDLFEAADIDLLANYADAMARYQAAVKRLGESTDSKRSQSAQSWSRLALAYADKLGFSQTGRARLARRKAANPPVDPMEQLLGDVTDFVNSDE